MANEELAQTLDRLHQQLSHGPQLDPATVQSLRSLLEEIQSVCATADTPATAENEPQPALSQRLQDVIADFEVRHPHLTVTLSQIADRLSDMGI